MVPIPLSRRLTAVTALLALLLSPWEGARACMHAQDHESHHAQAETGQDPMAAGEHPCHGMGLRSEAPEPGAHTPHHDPGPAGTTVGESHHDQETAECCADGCCASPGIPLEPAFVGSADANTHGQFIPSPSNLLTGEPVGLFRPPIG